MYFPNAFCYDLYCTRANTNIKYCRFLVSCSQVEAARVDASAMGAALERDRLVADFQARFDEQHEKWKAMLDTTVAEAREHEQVRCV